MDKSEIEGKRIAQLAMELSKQYDKCVLCGRLTKDRGIYMPNKTGQLGSNNKKYRVVIYSICWRHEKTEETANLVEEYLYKNQESMTNVTSQLLGDIQ